MKYIYICMYKYNVHNSSMLLSLWVHIFWLGWFVERKPTNNNDEVKSTHQTFKHTNENAPAHANNYVLYDCVIIIILMRLRRAFTYSTLQHAKPLFITSK